MSTSINYISLTYTTYTTSTLYTLYTYYYDYIEESTHSVLCTVYSDCETVSENCTNRPRLYILVFFHESQCTVSYASTSFLISLGGQDTWFSPKRLGFESRMRNSFFFSIPFFPLFFPFILSCGTRYICVYSTTEGAKT